VVRPVRSSRSPDYAADLSAQETQVRTSQAADLPKVLTLWEEARSEHASIPDRIEDLRGLIEDSPAALLVAEREGEIVGALIAAWDGWRGNMYRLAVREDCRRRGIGMLLTRAGEEYLHSRGARRVTALVALDDADAGGFWDAAGYPQDEEIGRRVRNIAGPTQP
jgi:ribosomal protein S18 acetylase RimI-like enzyme